MPVNAALLPRRLERQPSGITNNVGAQQQALLFTTAGIILRLAAETAGEVVRGIKQVELALLLRRQIGMQNHPDFYVLLGVDPSATPAEIQTAYRHRVQIVHPDRFKKSRMPEA